MTGEFALARETYETYRRAPNLTPEQRMVIPQWDDLADEVKAALEFAAKRLLKAVLMQLAEAVVP